MTPRSARSDGLTVEPNVFQRLMLQWEQLAPYNAAQFATLAADVDDEHVQAAWRDVVVTLGLQQIGQPPHAGVSIVHQPVDVHITAELNQPFEVAEPPLRPFILRDANGTSVGIVYRHVVADSASIRLLVRAWTERLLLIRSAVPARHIALLRSTAFRPLDAHRSWNILREGLGELSRMSRAKRVRRLSSDADVTSGVEWRRIALPAGMVNHLLALSRRRGVRVNDLFVAAAALACDELMPHEGSQARRDLGIGIIADVRPTSRPADRHFGLMLGFLQTFWREQDLRSWDRALAVAAAQSRLARQRSLAKASILRLLAAQRAGADKSAEDLAEFYRKRCPLSAGISNVNLNRDWQAALHPSPLVAYTRVSPLGPMLPLVFTPTTLGDTLHLGVTYRLSVLSTESANAVVTQFIAQLERAISEG